MINEYVEMNDRIFIKDVLSNLRGRTMVTVLQYINEILAVNGTFSIEQLAFFERFANPKFADAVDAVNKVRYFYNDLVANYMAIPDEDESKNESFRSQITYLADMLRKILIDLIPEDRAALTKLVAMSGREGTKDDGGSNFAAVVLEAEYLLMINKNWAQIDFAGEQLIVLDQTVCYDGAVLEFHGGINEAAIVINSKGLTGEYLIKEYDGDLYAVKPLVDLITVPEAGNKFVVRLQPNRDNFTEDKLKQLVELLSTTAEISRPIAFSANKAEHDFLYLLGDAGETKLIKIDLPKGNVAMSKFFNGLVGKIDQVLVCDSRNAKGGIVKQVLLLCEETGHMERKAKANTVSLKTYVAETIVIEEGSEL